MVQAAEVARILGRVAVSRVQEIGIGHAACTQDFVNRTRSRIVLQRL